MTMIPGLKCDLRFILTFQAAVQDITWDWICVKEKSEKTLGCTFITMALDDPAAKTKERFKPCVADLFAANVQGSPVSPQGSADTILPAPAINPLCMAGDQAMM